MVGFCSNSWVLFAEVKLKFAKNILSALLQHIHTPTQFCERHSTLIFMNIICQCCHAAIHIHYCNSQEIANMPLFAPTISGSGGATGKNYKHPRRGGPRKKAAQIENSSHKKVVKRTKITVMADVVVQVLAETVNTR